MRARNGAGGVGRDARRCLRQHWRDEPATGLTGRSPRRAARSRRRQSTTTRRWPIAVEWLELAEHAARGRQPPTARVRSVTTAGRRRLWRARSAYARSADEARGTTRSAAASLGQLGLARARDGRLVLRARCWPLPRRCAAATDASSPAAPATLSCRRQRAARRRGRAAGGDWRAPGGAVRLRRRARARRRTDAGTLAGARCSSRRGCTGLAAVDVSVKAARWAGALDEGPSVVIARGDEPPAAIVATADAMNGARVALLALVVALVVAALGFFLARGAHPPVKRRRRDADATSTVAPPPISGTHAARPAAPRVDGGAARTRRVILSAPWGSAAGQLGRRDHPESVAEGPMSFFVDGHGVAILDNVNRRLAASTRMAARCRRSRSTPTPRKIWRVRAIGWPSLDRLHDKRVTALRRRRHHARDLPLAAAGISEPAAVTGLFCDCDGALYVEREHGALAAPRRRRWRRRRRAARRRRDARSRAGRFVARPPSSIASPAARASLNSQRRRAARVAATVDFGAPLMFIALLDGDAAGRVYIGAHTGHESTSPPYAIGDESLTLVALRRRQRGRPPDAAGAAAERRVVPRSGRGRRRHALLDAAHGRRRRRRGLPTVAIPPLLLVPCAGLLGATLLGAVTDLGMRALLARALGLHPLLVGLRPLLDLAFGSRAMISFSSAARSTLANQIRSRHFCAAAPSTSQRC